MERRSPIRRVSGVFNTCRVGDRRSEGSVKMRALFKKVVVASHGMSDARSAGHWFIQHALKEMNRTARYTFILMALTGCSGCGTIASHTNQGPNDPHGVYRGVRLNVGTLSGPDRYGTDPMLTGCSICYVVWDSPFSFVADTILFPVDVFNRAPNPASKSAKQ
jgi:uncharacterized protein YceK